MKLLNIKELFSYLDYKDLRSVRRWCKLNNVFIIRHGRREFINEINFRKAFETPFINNLKKQHGNEWESVYCLYEERNITALTALHVISSPTSKSYKSENEIVAKYLAKYESDKKSKAA